MLPSERVRSWVNVYGRLGRGIRRAEREEVGFILDVRSELRYGVVARIDVLRGCDMRCNSRWSSSNFCGARSGMPRKINHLRRV